MQRNTTQRTTTITQHNATQQNLPQHNKTGNQNHAPTCTYAKQTSRDNVELDQDSTDKSGQKTLQV